MKEKFLDENHIFLMQYSHRNVIPIDEGDHLVESLWNKLAKKTNHNNETTKPPNDSS